MKATVQYVASKLPVFMKDVPIVQKREGNVVVNFLNKTDLTNFIDSQGTVPDADRYLMITCQCGKIYDYVLKTDVPNANMTCPCGRCVIKYA
jgi:hypothetical protein